MLHILVALLSNYDENSQVDNIPIFSTNDIEPAKNRSDFYIRIGNILPEDMYYYSNLYHLILLWDFAWVCSERLSSWVDPIGCPATHIYNYYIDMFIKEGTVIYNRANVYKDTFDLCLLIDFVASNGISLDLAQINIISTDIFILLDKYHLKQNLYVRRNFYNYHSILLYIYKLYNDMYLSEKARDYARFNYLVKEPWSIQRKKASKEI